MASEEISTQEKLLGETNNQNMKNMPDAVKLMPVDSHRLEPTGNGTVTYNRIEYLSNVSIRPQTL